MSIKATWRIVGVAVAAAVALAACSSSNASDNAGGNSAAGSAVAGTPQGGGTLTVDTQVEPTSFDPQVNSDVSNQVISTNIFQNLIEHGPDGKFHPWLASSWDVSPDALTYTFHLKQGVSFSDGTPFNADAVKANFDRKSTSPSVFLIWGSLPLKSYAVVDPYTFALVLAKPYAPLLDDLSYPGAGLISPSVLTPAKTAGISSATNLIGSGPFQVQAYTKGQNISLVPNPKYTAASAPDDAPNQGKTFLDKIDFKFISDPSIRLGNLQSGQSNVIFTVPPASSATVQKNDKLQIVSKDQAGMPYVLELNSAQGPLADKNVRQALWQGIDIDSLLKTIYFGTVKRAWTVVTPPTAPLGSYDSSLANSIKYSPDASDKLLDDAGWSAKDSAGYRTKDGQRLSLTWLVRSNNVRDQRDVLAQGIAAEAKKRGIEIKLAPVDDATYFAQLKAGKYDLSDTSLTRADIRIVDAVLESKYKASTGGYNWSNANDPQVDSLFTTAVMSSSSDADRVAAIKQVQQINNQQGWVLPLYVPIWNVASAKSVQGITFQLAGFPQLWTAWVGK